MQLTPDNISTDIIHLFDERNIQLSVLRLDKIHPVISGNKWFKLLYYLGEAKEQKKSKIVTFGGAWSNHILATAAACQLNGFLSAGIIRGEEPSTLSDTLIEAVQYGMQLHFISREDYSEKKLPADLRDEACYFIDEGGFGEPGARGAAQIMDFTKGDFTHCCCAAGTGTMMAGLANNLSPSQILIGISVLKNNHALENNVGSLFTGKHKNWEIIHDYHFGGYAKYTAALISFMNEFYGQTNIPSDFVYTAKLFFAVTDLINNNFFAEGSKLLLIHSGGLQGNRSLAKGTLIY